MSQCYARRTERQSGVSPMPKGLIFLLIMIAVIVIYTIAKIINYNRLSEQQWKDADKSKLKEWDDDDPWD